MRSKQLRFVSLILLLLVLVGSAPAEYTGGAVFDVLHSSFSQADTFDGKESAAPSGAARITRARAEKPVHYTKETSSIETVERVTYRAKTGAVRNFRVAVLLLAILLFCEDGLRPIISTIAHAKTNSQRSHRYIISYIHCKDGSKRLPLPE